MLINDVSSPSLFTTLRALVNATEFVSLSRAFGKALIVRAVLACQICVIVGFDLLFEASPKCINF